MANYLPDRGVLGSALTAAVQKKNPADNSVSADMIPKQYDLGLHCFCMEGNMGTFVCKDILHCLYI